VLSDRLPTFLVIGAAKAGTTSLHNYLCQHPDVFMSAEKEPRFFAFEGRSPDFCGPWDEGFPAPSAALARRSSHADAITELSRYQRLFRDVRGERAIGESSVTYLVEPGTEARIRRRLPEAKLIVVLRNPADRAYSAFLHSRRLGIEPLADFADALDAEAGRIARGWATSWQYARAGFYAEHLARYYAQFPREQIGVFLYDDLAASPVALVQAVCRFLGVDAAFVPDVSERHNVTVGDVVRPRAALLDRLLNRPNAVKWLAKQVVRRRRTRQWLRARTLATVGTVTERRRPAPLDADVRRRLLNLYRSDILRLPALTGVDVSHWLSARG